MSLERLQREYEERIKKRIKNKKNYTLAYEKLCKSTTLRPNPFSRKAKSVAMIDVKTNKVIKVFPSISVAASSLNKSYGSISQCINGRQKTAYGYKWAVVI